MCIKDLFSFLKNFAGHLAKLLSNDKESFKAQKRQKIKDFLSKNIFL